MKAITILQPYAHWIITGQKRVENRTWETKHRGKIAIHAGKSRSWMDVTSLKNVDEMSFGAIVGVAELVDCVWIGNGKTTVSIIKKYPWFFDHEHVHGPCCWVLESVVRLDHPIEWKGAQGLWNMPDDIAMVSS